MKKLIAILAVSAMVTTAVFAQATLSGTIETRFNLFRGNFNDDYGHTLGGSIGTAHIQFAGSNADGTLGAVFRFRNQDAFGYSTGSDGGARFHRAFVWWRPVDMFRLLVGVDPDGMFDTTQIAGWAFHQGNNDYMFNHAWGFWRDVFPGNWDHFGMAFSFFNIVDGLNVNLVLPTGRTGTDGHRTEWITRQVTIEQILAGFRFHSTFAVPGMGLLQFTYNAPGGHVWNRAPTTWEDAPDFGQLGLSFLLNGLDFGDFLIGGAVVIPRDDDDLGLHVGAAVTVPGIADLFELRARVGVEVPIGDSNTWFGPGGSFARGRIVGNIMPVVPLGPGSLMFDLGMTAAFPATGEDFDAEDHLGWFVGPVYRIPVASGAVNIGVHLRSGVPASPGANQHYLVRNNDITFNIPISLTFSF